MSDSNDRNRRDLNQGPDPLRSRPAVAHPSLSSPLVRAGAVTSPAHIQLIDLCRQMEGTLSLLFKQSRSAMHNPANMRSLNRYMHTVRTALSLAQSWIVVDAIQGSTQPEIREGDPGHDAKR